MNGVGLGLRWQFADALLGSVAVSHLPSLDPVALSSRAHSSLDFLEIAPENYIGRGGWAKRTLERARSAFPVVSHGLSLNLGGGANAPFDAHFLGELRALLHDLGAKWYSDHLSITEHGGAFAHELLPIRFSRETAAQVADRVRRVQDAIGVPMAVENVSMYIHPGVRAIDEAEFVAEICARAQCGWLCDVNNAWVNAQNFGTDIGEWLRTAPFDRVVQIHVAGPTQMDDAALDGLYVDTHGTNAPPPVLDLLSAVLEKTGPVPVLVERDTDLPTLDVLLDEVDRVRAVYAASVEAFEKRNRKSAPPPSAS